MEKNECVITKWMLLKQIFSAFNEDMMMSVHKHDYFEFVITLANGYLHTVNGRTFQPKVGEVVILRPSDSHSAFPFSLPEGVESKKFHCCRDIYVSPAMFKQACAFLGERFYSKIILADSPPSFILSAEHLADIDKRLRYPFFSNVEDVSGESGKQAEIIKKSIVAEILGEYVYHDFIAHGALPECLVKLLNRLQSPDVFNVSIAKIAEDVGYSQAYLSRRFKSCFGKTLEGYIIELRVEKSVALLIQTGMSVDEISIESGWEKTGNYISAFKKVMNITPAKYRVMYSENNNERKMNELMHQR